MLFPSEKKYTNVAVVREKEADECGLTEPRWLRRQVSRVEDDSLPELASIFGEEKVLEDAAGADKGA